VQSEKQRQQLDEIRTSVEPERYHVRTENQASIFRAIEGRLREWLRREMIRHVHMSGGRRYAMKPARHKNGVGEWRGGGRRVCGASYARRTRARVARQWRPVLLIALEPGAIREWANSRRLLINVIR